MPDHDDFESFEVARPYRERLNYWSVVRLLPDLKTQTIARFRSRSDADGHLQFLRQQLPAIQFAVLFDLSEGRRQEAGGRGQEETPDTRHLTPTPNP